MSSEHKAESITTIKDIHIKETSLQAGLVQCYHFDLRSTKWDIRGHQYMPYFLSIRYTFFFFFLEIVYILDRYNLAIGHFSLHSSD